MTKYKVKAFYPQEEHPCFFLVPLDRVVDWEQVADELYEIHDALRYDHEEWEPLFEKDEKVFERLCEIGLFLEPDHTVQV